MSIATLPELAVEVAGAALAEADARALVAIRVVQAPSVPAVCELHFVAAAGPLGTLTPDPVGLSLRVGTTAVGADPLFDGEITAVERVLTPSRGHELIVRGYDHLHRLRRRQPLRVFENVTPAGLARQLARTAGLTVEAANEGPEHPRLLQTGADDLEMLADVCARCGMWFAQRGNRLVLFELTGSGDPVPLTCTENLLEVRWELNGNPAATAVTATAWDPFTSAIHRGRADERRGAQELFAEVPADFLDPDGRQQVHLALQGDELARASAQAELDQRSMAAATVRGVANGDPAIAPGSRVRITGLGDRFDGVFAVTRVAHTFDQERGYQTEFASTPPRPVARPRGAGVVPGVVSSVQDPERLGRVRVTLPACADLETGWLAVLLPAAARDKGLVAIPEVGDHVLLLCAHEDPGQGVVLGGLFGGDAPDDSGVEGDRVQRYHFSSRGGQRLVLDDHGKLLRLVSENGSKLEFTPDRVLLHAAVDLAIEAPGRAITIAGKSVDFRRA